LLRWEQNAEETKTEKEGKREGWARGSLGGGKGKVLKEVLPLKGYFHSIYISGEKLGFLSTRCLFSGPLPLPKTGFEDGEGRSEGSRRLQWEGVKLFPFQKDET